jgi:choline dehydrogenase-like flavoprotein
LIIDARSVPAGTVIETEICIIGAGAAGITAAREFIDTPFRVVLLESGGMEYEPETQDLYRSENAGQEFPDTTGSRLRFFGGTTNHWGGWCLPLDAIDFEPRDDNPHYGWPFKKADLDPWYRRAQKVCQLGPYEYRPARWGMAPHRVPAPFAGPHFESKILQETWLRFGPVYAPELQRAPRVSVYLHANAYHLDGGETDAEIRELAVKDLSGKTFAVRARVYVLATGGLENARLLLASGRQGGNGLGNQDDLVGRFFMVHLVYSGGLIVPANPRVNLDFQTRDKYALVNKKRMIIPILGMSAESMRRLNLPNIIMVWNYRFSATRGPVQALSRMLNGEGPGGSFLSDFATVMRNLQDVSEYAVRRTLLGEGIPIEAIDIGCTCEQQPNPDSRVSLGPRRDRLWMPEIVVDWRATDEDKNKAIEILRLLGTEMGRTGFGRLRSTFVETGAWPSDLDPNAHHMGTTRMHRDPARGVVDANCRVHSVANLYVAGSSVFPTGGANNPTLTIVALALRLADHLKKRLG